MSKQITIGSDPEFFLQNKDTHQVVSSIPFLETDKYSPIQGENGLKYYSDNVAVEVTMMPSFSEKEFIENFSNVFTTLRAISDKVEPIILASAYFEAKELEHPYAREFGCNPEFCVYSRSLKQPPTNVRFDFRSAGGHIHFGIDGWEKADWDDFLIHPESKFMLTRALDIYLAVPLTIVDSDESALERKKLYGQPGRCRATPYGVEYRTLSNMWTNDRDICGWTYNKCIEIATKFRDNFSLIDEFDPTLVRQIISSGDKEKAVDFCKRWDIEIPEFYSYNRIPQW